METTETTANSSIARDFTFKRIDKLVARQIELSNETNDDY